MEMTVHDTIRAKEFIVVDEQGRDRGRLATHDGATVLEIGEAHSGANLSVRVEPQGNAKVELRSGNRTIRLLIDQDRVQVKLKNAEAPAASCGLTLDSVGAWVFAESTPDIGLRLLSNDGGNGALVWLSEKNADQGDTFVRTRYLRANPKEDATSGWRASC